MNMNGVWLVVAVALATIPAPAVGQAQTQTRTMSFDACLSRIRSTSTDLGVAPINIVETTDLRVVRWVTADGGVVMTCSRADQKMSVTVTKK
jgi:hypothetical protein